MLRTLGVISLFAFSVQSAVAADTNLERTIKIGSTFNDVLRVLNAASATKTKHDEAVGYSPRRSRSTSPPPQEHLYDIDERVRLSILVSRGDGKVIGLRTRFAPPEIKSRFNYHYAKCSAVIFHEDRSFSIRFLPRNHTMKEEQPANP